MLPKGREPRSDSNR